MFFAGVLFEADDARNVDIVIVILIVECCSPAPEQNDILPATCPNALPWNEYGALVFKLHGYLFTIDLIISKSDIYFYRNHLWIVDWYM